MSNYADTFEEFIATLKMVHPLDRERFFRNHEELKAPADWVSEGRRRFPPCDDSVAMADKLAKEIRNQLQTERDEFLSDVSSDIREKIDQFFYGEVPADLVETRKQFDDELAQGCCSRKKALMKKYKEILKERTAVTA